MNGDDGVLRADLQNGMIGHNGTGGFLTNGAVIAIFANDRPRYSKRPGAKLLEEEALEVCLTVV